MGNESSGNRGYRVKNCDFEGMGQRIDDLLFERNLAVSVVADAIKVDRVTLLNLMKSNDAKVSIISKIAKYFGVSIDWLVNGGDR